jgi:L-fuculose-phosphate aldolase
MLETISDIFKEAYMRGWITARDGNASIRYKEQQFFYVSPSGVRKQMLQPEMFKKIGIYYDELFAITKEMSYTDISHNLKPSGELPMHFLMQKSIDTDVRVVLHLHPTYTVAAMYKGVCLMSLVEEFPELKRYTRVGPTVPLIPPVTEELAKACVNNFEINKIGKVKYDILGMVNHGVISVDTSPWRAFEHIERLEHICKIILIGGK